MFIFYSKYNLFFIFDFRLPPSPKTLSTVSAHGPLNMVCIYEDEETDTHTTEQDKLTTEHDTHVTTQIRHSYDT